MTVRDYLNGKEEGNAAVFVDTPSGLCRVIRIDEKDLMPRVYFITAGGETAWQWALNSTELYAHIDGACPLSVDDCPECQDLYLNWQYEQQMEEHYHEPN